LTGPRIYWPVGATEDHKATVLGAIRYGNMMARGDERIAPIGAPFTICGETYTNQRSHCSACRTMWITWRAHDVATPGDTCPMCELEHRRATYDMTAAERSAMVRDLAQHPDALECMAVLSTMAQDNGELDLVPERIAGALLLLGDWHHPDDVPRSNGAASAIAAIQDMRRRNT
jgi:hypothetical protein